MVRLNFTRIVTLPSAYRTKTCHAMEADGFEGVPKPARAVKNAAKIGHGKIRTYVAIRKKCLGTYGRTLAAAVLKRPGRLGRRFVTVKSSVHE